MRHFSWTKLGRIFDPSGGNRHPKLATHAANPLPLHLGGAVYRIFYGGRDDQNRTSIGAVDIDIVSHEIVEDHLEPVYQHGPDGSFYADGVSIGNSYVAADGQTYVLFMAWEVPANAHWRGTIGRLRLLADKSLVGVDADPYIGRSDVDPVSLSYPWVQQSPSGGYQMWYGSTTTWNAGNGEMRHVLNFATSDDGLDWTLKGQAVPDVLGRAQAFSHPTVAEHPDGGLEMWYSYRGTPDKSYRIGYARSHDSTTWQLLPDSAGIDVSSDGWDSEMVEYPFVFDHDGSRFMLYNGNGYGKSGFGLAVLER